MSIVFDQNQQAFFLQTPNSTYVIGILKRTISIPFVLGR